MLDGTEGGLHLKIVCSDIPALLCRIRCVGCGDPQPSIGSLLWTRSLQVVGRDGRQDPRRLALLIPQHNWHTHETLLIKCVPMQAVRKNRYVILPADIEKGYKNNVKKSDTEFEFYK